MLFVACGGGGAFAHDEESATPDTTSDPKASSDATTTATDNDVGLAGPGPEVPYDRAIQKSVHNAYDRFEPLIDQLVYHRARSLELDIHVRREGATAPAGEWFVYHEDYPFMRATSCSQLSDCLGQLAAFHDAFPRHEVVTLFIDLKQGFEPGHSRADLDAAFVKALGRDNITTPADLIAACPGATSIREAVSGACQFPTLRALRGKFVLVTTGGTSCDTASPVASYGGQDPRVRVAFIGPNVESSCPVQSYDARPNVVFFNMPLAEKARAAEVKSRGLVARIYGGGAFGGLDDVDDFVSAKNAGAVHLATDKLSFEEDRWSATHLAHGYPFTCERCTDGLVEPGAVIGVRATSGDQFGIADSGFFAFDTDDADETWSALVSVPSSHVEPFAKACLVARASEDPSAASVAVCRAFDDNPARAQVRPTAGAATTSTEASDFDGLTSETSAFLRLAIKATGGGSEVTASASRDGKIWTVITRTTVSAPLLLRGVSVSSHGDQKVKGLFANLMRERGGTRALVSTAKLRKKAIGDGASGDAFDGVFTP